MSPEQCSGRPGDVDTRTDVYSLGVVLYELLCGRPPYDVGTTVLEAARTICERAPDRPRVANTAVRGDLETIVLTALAKESERRYQSAASLAADVRRFLADAPIAARPPSSFHELRLFARRNRLAVAAAVLAIVALVGGTVTSLAFGIQASREAADRAVAEQRARHDAAVAQSVNTFLEGVLEQANPRTNPLGRELSLRESLEIAAEVIPDDEPEVAGTIHRMLGANFRALGALERSERHLVEAQALLAAARGRGDSATVETMNELALSLIEQRRLDDALTQLEATLPLARALPPERHEVLMSVLNNYGLVYLNKNDGASAEPYLREGIEQGIRIHGERHPEVATMMHNMGAVYLMQDKFEEADRTLTDALKLRREIHGSVHPDIPQSLSTIVFVRRRLGNLEGVDDMLIESIEIRRSLYGDSHPLLARSLNNRVSFLHAQEHYEEAVPIAREALEMFQATLPDGHPDLRFGHVNLAAVLMQVDAYEEAELHLLEAWSKHDADPAAPAGRRRQTVDHFVALYEYWSKPDEAARWQANRGGDPGRLSVLRDLLARSTGRFRETSWPTFRTPGEAAHSTGGSP